MTRVLQAGCVAALVAGAAAGAVSPASAATATAPDRTAPLATTQHGPTKGHPPRVGPGAGQEPNIVTPFGTFNYAQAFQSAVADGAFGYYTIEKPKVAPGDGHSLAEIAAESSDGRQIVEIGWTVDRALNGDDDPHLFVFHWIDGQPTCYNGCGFVPANQPGYTAGMKLPVTSTPIQFAILHHGAEWVVSYNGHHVGSFPDSEWTNRFKVTGRVQWFGEVNTATEASCTQMGNAQPAGSPTAARVERMGFQPARVLPAFITGATTPAAYSVSATGANGFRFGGPGACQSVPNLVGLTTQLAKNAITRGGLVVGSVSPITDPQCNNLNLVASQTPAASTRVPLGTMVNIRFFAPPASGCP